MSSDSKFKRGQTIREIGTGDQYTVVIQPVPYSRLWSLDQPFYWIRSHGKAADHILWAIAKSTLEEQFEADATAASTFAVSAMKVAHALCHEKV